MMAETAKIDTKGTSDRRPVVHENAPKNKDKTHLDFAVVFHSNTASINAELKYLNGISSEFDVL